MVLFGKEYISTLYKGLNDAKLQWFCKFWTKFRENLKITPVRAKCWLKRCHETVKNFPRIWFFLWSRGSTNLTNTVDNHWNFQNHLARLEKRKNWKFGNFLTLKWDLRVVNKFLSINIWKIWGFRGWSSYNKGKFQFSTMVLRGGGPSSISNYKKVHILGTGLVPQLGTPPVLMSKTCKVQQPP